MAAEEHFLRQAIDLALANVRDHDGRPFGALVVKDGEVIATGVNEIGATGDPTDSGTGRGNPDEYPSRTGYHGRRDV